MLAHQILQLVETAFSDLGITDPLFEAILLKDRNYVGNTFRAGGFVAIWFVEKKVVEVHDPEGRLVKTIDLNEDLKRAA
jgi:hypothetical protein